MSLAVASGAHAQTVVAGVKLDDTTQVNGQTLKLNGAGVRYKVVFKVYVAALYLPELRSTTQEVLALPGAKRVTLVMMRDLSNDDLGQRFLDGLRNNLDTAERTRLVGAMVTFGKIFSTVLKLKKGDVLTFDWVPGTGVVCQLNGEKIGDHINDANFYNGVLKIWLGNQPADETLKHKMLNSKD
ncbi:MAG: lipoprotein transmembrane [Burkholderiaceae bacterium]|nr:MAG: lipoprotein transmembrane [Burkholderiaceae bacterium]